MRRVRCDERKWFFVGGCNECSSDRGEDHDRVTDRDRGNGWSGVFDEFQWFGNSSKGRDRCGKCNGLCSTGVGGIFDG